MRTANRDRQNIQRASPVLGPLCVIVGCIHRASNNPKLRGEKFFHFRDTPTPQDYGHTEPRSGKGVWEHCFPLKKQRKCSGQFDNNMISLTVLIVIAVDNSADQRTISQITLITSVSSSREQSEG